MTIDERNKHRDDRAPRAAMKATAITIDGTTGNVVIGTLPLIPPPIELPAWLAEFLGWADERQALDVWANADTPGGRAQGARSRRDRHRAVPHRAHVHAAATACRSCRT